MRSGCILYIDDDRSLWPVVGRQFTGESFRFMTASRGAEGLNLALRESPSLVLLDLRLPDTDGLSVLRRLRLRNCRAPVLVVTSYGSPEAEREVMEAGAVGYLEKPLVPAQLRETAMRVLSASGEEPGHGVLVGDSRELQDALHLATRLAPTNLPVLIQGESGTGKELLAQVVHFESPRARGPLVVFDPSSVPETLLESTLFGHERGAFTGAVHSAQGVFEMSSGGTLVIDEIGNLPYTLQGKLLRVLQDHRLRPLGSSRWVELDLRVVASTNVDLGGAVAAKTFRLDLYHRLNGGQIHMPPLRSRPGDIPLLVEHFVAEANRRGPRKVPGVSAPAMALLTGYGWPGNVRELANAVAFAHSMASGPIVPSDLPAEVRTANRLESLHHGILDAGVLDRIAASAIGRGRLDIKRLLAEVTASLEREVLSRLLRGRTQAAVAAILGLDPGTVSRKRQSLGLAAASGPGKPREARA